MKKKKRRKWRKKTVGHRSLYQSSSASPGQPSSRYWGGGEGSGRGGGWAGDFSVTSFIFCSLVNVMMWLIEWLISKALLMCPQASSFLPSSFIFSLPCFYLLAALLISPFFFLSHLISFFFFMHSLFSSLFVVSHAAWTGSIKVTTRAWRLLGWRWWWRRQWERIQVTPEEGTKRTDGEARVAAETNQRGWQVINTSDFSLCRFQFCLKE